MNLLETYASLAEKEKINGHHSPEGAAIRIFSRALTGWLAGSLGKLDVLALCERGMEDWLKRRLALRPWSTQGLPELLGRAMENHLITRLDAVGLEKMHLARARLNNGSEDCDAGQAENALELCIRVVEKHW